jgi:hypothetical protein
MIGTTKFLPGTGRGTIRRMVEGYPPLKSGNRCLFPSVSASRCHLPGPGRI